MHRHYHLVIEKAIPFGYLPKGNHRAKLARMTDSKIVNTRRKQLQRWIDTEHNGSQVSFIDKTGINQGELSALLKNKSFGEKKARKLETDAGMPAYWLDNQNEQPVTETTYKSLPLIPEHKIISEPIDSDLVLIRFGNFRLQAGIVGFAIDYYEKDHDPLIFRRDWMISKGYKPEKMVICKIKGDSMEEALFDGDVVMINTESVTPIDGNVFAVNYEGELLIKRMKRDAGRWYLSSDNKDKSRHPDKLCEGDFCIVLGEVVQKQSGKI